MMGKSEIKSGVGIRGQGSGVGIRRTEGNRGNRGNSIRLSVVSVACSSGFDIYVFLHCGVFQLD
jgi:hypothetical protein